MPTDLNNGLVLTPQEKYRLNHPDRVKITNQNWRKSNPKKVKLQNDRQKNQRKQWYENNKERVLVEHKVYYQNNRDKILLQKQAYGKEKYRNDSHFRETILKRGRKNSLKLKLEVMSHYCDDEPYCQCSNCNERRIEFLTIDHIKGNGNKHRKEIGIYGGDKFYRWLKKNNYPEGYQVLCMNCNHAKGHYDCCPHEKESQIIKNMEYVI